MANKVTIEIVGNNVYAVNAIDGTKKKLTELDSKAKQSSSMFERLGKQLAGAFSVYAIATYGSELLALGNKVRGVESAFNRIDQGNYLESLRAATKGLISDLELMQAATFADKFKIPFDILVKGLEFAQLTAIETGQSFEYMMQSFVTGTARQSEKILDNLGISAKTLKLEVKSTGNFMTALSNIMDRELKKMRGSMDESILTSRQFGAEMENAWNKIGVGISYAFNWLTEYGNKLNLGFTIASELVKQQGESDKLAMERYDVLAATFNLFENSKEPLIFLTEEQQKTLKAARERLEKEKEFVDLINRETARAIYGELAEKILEVDQRFEEYTKKYPKHTEELVRWREEMKKYLIEESLPKIEIPDELPYPDLEILNDYSNRWEDFYHYNMAMRAKDKEDFIMTHLVMQGQTEAFFGNMAGAAMNFYDASGNAAKGWFGVYKAMAIAQTAIATYQAAVEAYKSMVGIPIVGPGLAIAAAAAATAFGLSNIARIASMQPGGSFGGGVPSAAPSLPAGNVITNNNNQRSLTANITVITSDPNFDRDRFARDILASLRKAEADGG